MPTRSRRSRSSRPAIRATLDVLKGKDLERALDKVEYELKFLYRVNFSNTLNMIEAMRGGLAADRS